MFLQAIGTREGAFTERAGKRFVSCVSYIMFLQVTTTREVAFTESAGKGFFFCVSSIMYFQFTWLSKPLVTSHTPVLHGGQGSGD